MEYPVYYRNEGCCLIRFNDLQIKLIKLPPEVTEPERFTTTFPSLDRAEEFLSKGWVQVSRSTWRDFESSFRAGVIDETIKRIKAA